VCFFSAAARARLSLDCRSDDQGMKGVPQPRVALSQLVCLDVSRNFLRGQLDDQLLFQLTGVVS